MVLVVNSLHLLCLLGLQGIHLFSSNLEKMTLTDQSSVNPSIQEQ